MAVDSVVNRETGRINLYKPPVGHLLYSYLAILFTQDHGMHNNYSSEAIKLH